MNIVEKLFRASSKLLPSYLRIPLYYYYCKQRGALETELIQLRNIVPEGNTAIDIGANEGIWSFALSRCFDRVEAFEPLPECVKKLKEARLKQVRIHDMALSSKPGVCQLTIPNHTGKLVYSMATLNDTYDNEIHDKVSVPVATLDDFQFRNVDFIKIDVEGHELEVLKGAHSTICREKPIMIIEIEQRHLKFPMETVINYVIDLGYKAFFLDGRDIHSISEFTYENNQKLYLLQSKTKLDLISKNYINNFIFLPT
jgi:FkbM family methyltransferase